MKILIGCPTSERYSYCADLWIERVREIIEYSKNSKIIEADYLLVDNSKSDDFFKALKRRDANAIKAPYFENVKERIAYSRNILGEKALRENYDYLLSLEQDVIPEKDIIEKLLGHNKKIISAYYSKPVDLTVQDKNSAEIRSVTIELPIIYLQDGEKVRRANPNEILDKGLLKVGGFGLGCVMIHREVLEKTRFRCEKDKKAFDDLLFCHDAKKLGYGLFLDSGIKAEHLHKAWK
jgi:GT2 family glycosyltransferase